MGFEEALAKKRVRLRWWNESIEFTNGAPLAVEGDAMGCKLVESHHSPGRGLEKLHG